MRKRNIITAYSTRSFTFPVLALCAALALLGFVGCSADDAASPTAPPASPTPPVPPTAPLTVTVTVTVTPPALDASSSAPATVTVQATRSDGQAIPAGTQAVLTTTIGSFSFIGGPATITLDLVNGRAQTVLFGNGTVGVAIVRAQVTLASGQTGVGNANLDFRAPATFFISSVSPNFGSPNGGEQVTIFGGGFSDPIRVLFGGLPATIVSDTGNQIRVITPQIQLGAGETRAVDVQVTINLNQPGQLTDTLPLGFTYAAGSGPLQPIVLSVNPTSGTNDGGTTVTINGDGFESPVQVLFGQGTTAGSFTGAEAAIQDVSRTRIVVTTPPARGFGLDNQNQNVNILVKNVNSGRSVVATSAFRYGVTIQITAMGPGSGPAAGGTRVTIFGQGFDDPVAVSLGGVGQTVVAVSGSEVDFITSGVIVTSCPANGVVTVSPVSVTNIEGGQSASANIAFNYIVPLPQIFGVSPTSGAAGSNVTISGQNFASSVQVVFGDPATGSSAPIVSNTATQIVAKVPPPPPAFTFNTEPCDGNADGVANGTRLVPTPISVSVRNLDGTGCVATLSNAFLLSPPNTTCTGDTSVPPTPPSADFTFTTDGALTAIFDDTSTGGPTSWQWNFGDPASGGANTSSQQNPAHTFSGAGTYTVTLTVSNTGGSDAVSKFVTVP